MQHFYKGIQGWSAFLELYDEMVRAAPKAGAVFVEVGAWKGRSAAYMGVLIANSGKAIDFHVVDHFLGAAEQIARAEPELVAGNLYEVFLANIAPVGKFITVHRMGSIQAAALFADRSIDFLLVDGSHDYESVLADLKAWYPKMKDGATIGGDDWTKPGVRQAVLEFYGEPTLFGGTNKKGWRKCWRGEIHHQDKLNVTEAIRKGLDAAIKETQ